MDEVWTTRRTPAMRAAVMMLRVPCTLTSHMRRGRGSQIA
jgi:hypothetical protein